MTLLTNGDFKAKLSRGSLCGNTDKPFVEADFLLLEGPDQGKIARAYMYFTGGAREITLRQIEICGWNPETDLDATFPYNNEVVVNISDDVWEGKPRNRVRVNDPARGSKPLEEKVAKNFLGDLSRAYKAERKAAGVPSAAVASALSMPKTNGASQGTDEDIPF